MNKTTILSNLIKISKRDTVSFHVPGHKNGRIFKKYYSNFIDNISKLDTTEIYGTDNLHAPIGIIKEAQKKAATFYGAKNTFFLINGTTCGIHSMIMAVTKPGDQIIVTRDCHRSVINGIILSQLTPIYVNPQIDHQNSLSMGVDPKAIEKALIENPSAKAVIITYPNYYGICSDIEEISRIIHKYNKLLLVDEAHGAHLKLSDKLPISSLDLGADIVVQSTHKTLAAFTQASLLHVKSEKVDIDKLKFMISLNQSTSPSYILMTSLDMAMEIAIEEGHFLMEKLINNINEFKNDINELKEVGILSKERIGKYEGNDLDDTKITFSMKDIGISGIIIEEILRKKYNIQVEMSNMFNVLAISTIGNERSDFERLKKALISISRDKSITHKKLEIPEYSFKVPKMSITPREAVYRNKKNIPFLKSRGKISGEYIIPYPPGIPLICPGEIITDEIIDYAKILKSIGLNIIGMGDDKLDTIKVIT